MDSKLRIAYDPSANALYVTLADLKERRPGATTVDEQGVIVDTFANGEPRGYEFLSVRERGVPTDSLPEYVARAIEDFISLGYLESSDFVEREIGENGQGV